MWFRYTPNNECSEHRSANALALAFLDSMMPSSRVRKHNVHVPRCNTNYGIPWRGRSAPRFHKGHVTEAANKAASDDTLLITGNANLETHLPRTAAARVLRTGEGHNMSKVSELKTKDPLRKLKHVFNNRRKRELLLNSRFPEQGTGAQAEWS